MKVLQFSDSHLGLMSYRIPERLIDMAAVLDEVALIAINQGVDLVINAGDTFDQPKPDPYSILAYRRFVDKLEESKIPIVEVVGNHNRHDIIDKIGQGTWPSAIHDWIFCSNDSEGWISQTIHGKRLVAANWMPREKLLRFLETMRESPPDILVLHQMCGGFLPRAASNAEISFEELQNAAKLICIGDVHVWGTHRGQGKIPTVIHSTGSTEMTKIDEDVIKSVAIFHLDKPAMPDPITIERIDLHPRRQQIFNIRSDIELSTSTARVELDIMAGMKPMVTVIYSPNMQRGVDAMHDQFKGKVLWRDVPDGEVDSTASFEAAKASANTDMPGILGEIINDDPALLGAAIALWGSPDNHQAVLDELKSSIITRLTPVVTLPS